jgi:hypothetical protein
VAGKKEGGSRRGRSHLQGKGEEEGALLVEVAVADEVENLKGTRGGVECWNVVAGKKEGGSRRGRSPLQGKGEEEGALLV